MTRSDEVRNKSYEDLHVLLSTVPKAERLNVLGDLSIRVRTDRVAWEGTLGPQAIGNFNNNGLLLKNRADDHPLLTNTLFRIQTREKTTWMHTPLRI
ncbi:hypothetical protein SprV_0200889800 [Sparganum proliferum]